MQQQPPRLHPPGIATGTTAIVLAVVTLILAVGGSSWFIRQQAERAERQRVLAQRLLMSMLDQETGLRGYLLSGDRSFLAPYLTGRTQFDSTRTALHQSFGTSDEHRMLDDEVAVAREWQHLAQQRVAAMDAGTFVQDTRRLRARKRRMSAFRAMHAELTSRLDQQSRSDRRRAELVPVLVSSALSILAVLLGVWLLRRSRRIHAQLRELHDAHVRHQQAFDINDGILQRLVVADMALKLDNQSLAGTELTAALDEAKAMVTRMADGARPGTLTRETAAGSAQPAPDDA